MTDVIDSFSGEHSFLSNFFPSPIQWRFQRGVVFPTVEHGFVWHKTTNPITRNLILQKDMTPGQVKRFGRRNVELRPDWEDIKLSVMKELVFEKFVQNPVLMGRLFDTGDAELIEGNHWNDTFWGVCNGRGSNHLGKILMDVRTVLKQGE